MPGASVAAAPVRVTTVTSAHPAACAGVVAVICVSLSTVKEGAGNLLGPKRTARVPVKWSPVSTTVVWARAEAESGWMAVTASPGT